MKNKKLLIIALLIILASSATGYYFWSKSNTDKDLENKIETEVVKRDSIISSIFTTGKVTANLDIEIKCKASGEIISLPFDVSDKVGKGALMLKLNPIDEQRNVRQSQMTLLQSKALLIKAKTDLLLFKKNLTTGKEQALNIVKSAKIKQLDLMSKAKRSSQLYMLSTERKVAISNLESARIKAKDLRIKADNAKKLYFNKSILSKNDYETALIISKQADIDVKNAQAKLIEQDTNNKADYETALTNSKQAKNDLETAQAKLQEQSNSSITKDIKNQDIQAAEAKVESDKLSLLTSQQRLKDTEVFAPISGVVTTRPVQVGQIISSGISNVGGGTTVLTLSDLSRMFVMASVDESDIGKIKLGEKVNVSADAFPNKKFKGKVVQIYSKGVTVSNVVTFLVKIELLGKNKNVLKPEMTSNIEIVQQNKQNILVVPSNSLTRKKGKYFVKVLKPDNKQEDRAVSIGINDEEKYEVTEGIKEGEKVVLAKSEVDSKWKKDPNNKNGSKNSTNNAIRQTKRITGGGGGGSRGGF
ncbi:MAG: efflux RND transporter periplasmic adaptor subunit [Candidatus Sericytochromatia bacterium]|nr:efflux RND transporter periplasmic adaptor subunit [Candidatus Sericytochromatia bacterium]